MWIKIRKIRSSKQRLFITHKNWIVELYLPDNLLLVARQSKSNWSVQRKNLNRFTVKLYTSNITLCVLNITNVFECLKYVWRQLSILSTKPRAALQSKDAIERRVAKDRRKLIGDNIGDFFGRREIAWSTAQVLRHWLACRVSAKSSVIGTKFRDTRVRDKPGGARLRWRRRRFRIRVAGKGAERCIFVRFDLTTYTRPIEKGRVNPSPGGWVI